MAFNFQRGDFCPVGWDPEGAIPEQTLNIKTFNADITSLLFDVTNTGSLGLRARLAGPTDVAGSVTADFDADLPIFQEPPFLRPGGRGLILLYVTPARSIQVPSIIEKLHFESGVEHQVSYAFDVKCDSRLNHPNGIVYPVF